MKIEKSSKKQNTSKDYRKTLLVFLVISIILLFLIPPLVLLVSDFGSLVLWCFNWISYFKKRKEEKDSLKSCDFTYYLDLTVWRIAKK